jgi:DNA-binding NarL/FixJ family response regulator
MIRTPALKVLIASSHADTRVAVSWMLRQTFPDAIVSKAETVSEALQTAAAETPACVVGDASLADFATEVSGFAQTLWQRGIPLIVIHDDSDVPQTDSGVCPGIAARLVRSSINVSSVDLAVSTAIELSSMASQINALERELESAKEQLESTTTEAAAVRADFAEFKLAHDAWSTTTIPPAEPSEAGSPAAGTAPAGLTSTVSPGRASTMSATLERPHLITSGLDVSTQDERELAGRVQKDLMPPGSPLVDGFDIAGLSIPAETTGGDYYDYLPMADDLLCVSIGECSGRGLAPAMVMASLRAYLRVLASSSTDISDVLSRVNTLITEDIGDEEFIVTLMLFLIDAQTRSLRYASAGHQAFFLDRHGNVDVLHSTGMPLGLRDETVILEGPSRKIRTGEILLLASDGVQKMTSESGEQFGTERMLNLVKENRTLPSRIIASYLRKACTEFASPQFRSDDVTIVIVKGDDS